MEFDKSVGEPGGQSPIVVNDQEVECQETDQPQNQSQEEGRQRNESRAGDRLPAEHHVENQENAAMTTPVAAELQGTQEVCTDATSTSATVDNEVCNVQGVVNCFICHTSTDEDGRLRGFTDQIWVTIRRTASQRRNLLLSDKYAGATSMIQSRNTPGALQYHPSCRKNYSAVKRPRDVQSDDQPTTKRVCIETRKKSVIPKFDQQGLLKGSCIFCGKARKKKKGGKEESREKVSTVDGCKSLSSRAEFSTNQRIKSLVWNEVDFVAKEAEYHKSCWALFNKETSASAAMNQIPEKTATHTFHKRAFAATCSFIKGEVIERKRSLLVSSLLETYREEFVNSGGERETIQPYAAQSLVRKITGHFGEVVRIQLLDNRKGNFLCCASLTEDEAKARLYDDSQHLENEKLKWAALHLRSKIMELPRTMTPSPANVQNLKECSPKIPNQLDLFFRTLICGASSESSQDTQKDAVDRKVNSMASDAVYNISRGSVKPWKHTALGLGLASLTGSKQTLEVINRAGHSISYSETKGLETEFAYSIQCDNGDIPDGIKLSPDLATASVWDNNDKNIETLDGKDTFHCTVGHTYQNIIPSATSSHTATASFREGRNRRRFSGNEREVPPFHKALNAAKFTSPKAATETSHDGATATAAETGMECIPQKPLDFYWLWKSMDGNTPLHAGFISQYTNDPLPIQRICYMDPISRSPTNNDVVKETMMRSMNVAKETGQEYAVVTYDLAVAQKAYAIQQIEHPLFDELLIMLGNFHVELAFYGAVGTFISECGIEFLLTEAGVLAEGSLTGFIKGKFYNRCTRVHDLLANVLERKLYEGFLLTIPADELEAFQHVMSMMPIDPSQADEHLQDPAITKQQHDYEEYLHAVMAGSRGSMAQYWSIYIYLINRLHRELQRCVKTNDVRGYISIFPRILDVFFALNRPNYSRWGMLFFQKLSTADPRLMDILESGAFSIKRTKKNYSRSAVDLSLEQTVNRDAGSSMKGIVAFRNNDQAMRRWALTKTQRAHAVSEMKSLVGLEQGENPSAQLRPCRIVKDNEHMASLSRTLDEFCNPFAEEATGSLVNIATGRVASHATATYLLSTLTRGEQARDKFQGEWDEDPKRFLRPVKRLKVQNFASENTKPKATPHASKTAQKNAESLRDVFIRMVVIIAEKASLDLRHILSFPITAYPLSLAHCDGSHVKTNKAALLQRLESLQTEPISQSELPNDFAKVYDGGLVLHSVLSQTHVGASYGSIARSVLSMLCSGRGTEVHICLDKYVENSIKDSERKLRGAADSLYVITGPEQTIRQSGQKLLTNGTFKNELGKFFLQEWGKDHYRNIVGGKTVIASFGGECLQYVPDEPQQEVTVTKPAYLQGDHEEADTLMAFHIANITANNVVVRASDTDVLVILVGMLGKQRPEVRAARNIIMDCGMGNSRRYINITNITNILEDRKPGLSRALPGFHAFTGCDFTSAFYRKGKMKPLDIVEGDGTGKFVELFINMGDPSLETNLENDIASEFVCRMYTQNKTEDVDEARYRKLIAMTGKIDQENPLANIKKLDCSLLPPTRRTLEMKVRRARYTTMLWTNAIVSTPSLGLSPCDYGWRSDDEGRLQPLWFDGSAIPDYLYNDTEDEDTAPLSGEVEADTDGGSETEAWSEDSDSDEDESDGTVPA